MDDIYKYNNDFDNKKILEKLDELAELEDKEEDENKRFELLYARFIQGLRLSTWNNLL